MHCGLKCDIIGHVHYIPAIQCMYNTDIISIIIIYDNCGDNKFYLGNV